MRLKRRCKELAYQLRIAQMKLKMRVTWVCILFLSRAIIPSATSLMKLTSSSSRLLWPEVRDRAVRFASKSSVPMTGDSGEVGAIAEEFKDRPMDANGGRWTCLRRQLLRQTSPTLMVRKGSMNAQGVSLMRRQ